MATARGTMTVAELLKNIPLQKVIGPGSVEVVNMDSFWASQVCLSFKLLCGDFPTEFPSHDISVLSLRSCLFFKQTCCMRLVFTQRPDYSVLVAHAFAPSSVSRMPNVNDYTSNWC